MIFARPGATSILTQIGPNLTQLTLGAMSNIGQSGMMIRQLCINSGHSSTYIYKHQTQLIFFTNPWITGRTKLMVIFNYSKKQKLMQHQRTVVFARDTLHCFSPKNYFIKFHTPVQPLLQSKLQCF